ncbi:CAMK/CAMK-unique protein kinase [Ephemerocybe angulata]|uniref:CAMK/CAMK-unique protein kinase n=1 Tax=Ephemerocybe angulata TaxID=980116 RepID=A0A8H6I453_9AGAR|nr:CAMK/CAMK-unique protein kinase [Tulosesus angulatus]
MRTSASIAATIAENFFDVPHLAPVHHRPDDHSSKSSLVTHGLDQEQKLSASLTGGDGQDDVEDDDDDEDEEQEDDSMLTYDPFFFPRPALPSPSPPLAASAPEAPADLSSSPAAMFLSAFMSPKAEPAHLPDDEGQSVGGYTLGPIVGYGSFSTIRKAYSASGGVVAIKIVRGSDLVRTGHAPVERKKLEHEEAIWSTLSHEHILPLFSAVHTTYADFFITLYCPAGSLYDILKRDGSPALPQDDAGMMFRQVVRGLRYLHEDAMLVHRDMKLENVLVDESGVCRIGDFGLSVKIGQVQVDEDAVAEDDYQQHDASGYNTIHRAFSLSLPKRPARITSSLNPISRHLSARNRSATSSSHTSHIHQPGSMPYAAPELLLPNSAELAAPHPSQDIWALGVMLYALQMKIMNGAFDVPKDIGRGAERILHGCLERNVSKRWNISMVDDVAWGVGWGSAGDDATPEVERDSDECLSVPDEPEAEPYQNAVDTIVSEDEEDWQQEERRPRAFMEAATRRSTSRVQRSLSRAPIISRNRSGRSVSRASSPPRSAVTASSSFFPHNDSDVDSVSLSPTGLRSPPLYYDSVSRSRSASRPRGRKLKKSRSYFPSRSPSPSVVPTTPVDIGSHVLARMHLEDHPEELELEPPVRGRSIASEYRPMSLASRWSASYSSGGGSHSVSSSGSSRDRSVDFVSPTRRALAAPAVTTAMTATGKMDYDATIRQSSRPGSMPPTPGSLQQIWGDALMGVGAAGSGDAR